MSWCRLGRSQTWRAACRKIQSKSAFEEPSSETSSPRPSSSRPTTPSGLNVSAAKIRVALGEAALAIEHIGSTSVPGLSAKPVVDVLLVVEDSSNEASYVPALESAGYVLRWRERNFHEHRMLRTAAKDVHVHVYSAGSQEIYRYLLLRDHLRRNEEDRALYARTKRDLATRDWPSMQHYAEAKTEVIEGIIARAAAARSSQVE